MEPIEALRLLQLAFFVLLGAIGLAQWWRRRTRPAAYLAATFLSLAGMLTLNRVVVPQLAGGTAAVVQSVALLGLLAFPYLLMAFAWSFEGPLPTWLRLSLVPGAVVGAWTAWNTLFEPVAEQAMIIAFVSLWVLLSLLTAVRLTRSGGRAPVVRARMRLMGVGLLIMSTALLIAGFTAGQDLPVFTLVTTLLTLIAALAFWVGFAPPLPLRLWWRRSADHDRMQAGLIGAATPQEAAEAVVPVLADLVGGGVALIGRDGEIDAVAHLSAERVALDRSRLLSGEDLDDDARVVEVDSSWLVMRSSPYTPVFGEWELELAEGFAVQLRLALERAELFQAHLEARAEAEAASRELEATLMGLSHDLKSPTAAIAGFAVLLEQTRDPEERRTIVEQIRASTGYLEDLVDALLEFYKVGRTNVEVQPVDLADTVRLVTQRVTVTDPRVEVVVEGRLPVLMINPLRAEQIFDNLIGNAAKHAGHDAVTVTVSAVRTDEGVEVAVADDGRGIEPDDRERIFALFGRGAGASRSGSGVGLGMVRRIAESYGGELELGEVPVGARFVLRLPETVVVENGDDGHDSSPAERNEPALPDPARGD